MTSKTALILKGDSYKAVGAIFEERGWNVTYDDTSWPTVNLVVFTGGSDVSPYIYGEEPDGARGCDPKRDEYEKSVYEAMVNLGTPMVGICRGGQLLNVLNGGKMIQHLGETRSGDVLMFDDVEQKVFEVRVDHHQGMISGDSAMPIGWSEDDFEEQFPDYAVWYEETKSFCFQPHPEWGHKGTKDYFFELVDKYIGTPEG